MLAIAAGLIPLLIRYVPDIAGWFGGDDAERTAAQVVGVVQTITGGATDAASVAAALDDPAAAQQVALRLAEIAAAREAARDAAITERLKAAMADTAGARQQTVALAQAKSPLAYGSAMVSAVVLLLFSFTVIAEQIGYTTISDGTKRLVEAAMMLVMGYWVGSSAGSAAKDVRSAQTAATLAETAVQVGVERAAGSLFGGRR